MATPNKLAWSTVATRGASKKVLRPLPVSMETDSRYKLQANLIYQHVDLDYQIMMRQAAAIVKQALTPGSVLFSLPAVLFKHRSDAYKLIEDQCGDVQGFRPINNYGTRSAGEIMVEVKFKQAASTTMAITKGVSVKNMLFKGSPSIPSGNNTLVHVKMTLLRIPDQETFLADLKRSLRYYGEVYQVKEFTCGVYFEGGLSVILDISAGYIDASGNKVKNEPLTNNLYLEEWDCFASATFKGARTVCHWCHVAGHIRSKCPELAKTRCFSCYGNGHTAKFCKKKNATPSVVPVLADSLSAHSNPVIEQVVSDSDTDISEASASSNVAPAGSAASKYATTVEMVSMELDRKNDDYTAATPMAGPSRDVVGSASKSQSHKRSVLGKPSIPNKNNRVIPKLVVRTPPTIRGHKLFTKTKCSATGSVLVNSDDIIREARGFYQELYTPDLIDDAAVDSLLARIPDDVVLSVEDSDSLTDPILMDTRQDLVGHTPLGKSPGLDGLSFKVYKYLFKTSADFRTMLLGILNDVLIGVFAPSWQQTRMVLLFKKGDPMLNTVLPQLINPYQTGFMRNRLISDNGWLNQMFMANTRDVAPGIPQLAVLLDQEKAYDRVHPDYLRKVIFRFGFPLTLVDSLGTLFFGTEISISMNGWFGMVIPQSRGLRQGNSFSPLLFNLAFEPLLRSIPSCSGLSGVSLGGGAVSSAVCPLVPSVWIDTPNSSDHDFISQSVVNPPSPVKLLRYADDLEVFLNGPGEWPQNGVGICGVGHTEWVDIAQSEGLDWHNSGSVGAVRYLRYPLYHTSTQLDAFLNEVRLKILRHSNILRQRNLSLRGSGLVANSLLLSRLWHILRVVSIPAKWLDSVQALVRGYLLPFWPRTSISTMYVPQKFGGVSLVDVYLQQLALQHIYIQRLISGPNKTDFVSPWLVRGIQLYTGYTSILPCFLYPAKSQNSLKRIVPLAQLGKILQKLPPLSLSSTWSVRWFLDLPLQCVVTVGDAVNTWSPTLVRSSVPVRYLVSDIFSWNPATDNFKNTRVVNARKVKEVRRALYPSDCWFAATGFLPTALHNQTNRNILLPTWLPALYYWTIPQGRGNMVTVSGIRPGDLRWYWHPDRAKFEIRALIPQVVPTRFLLWPSLWRLFWSLYMMSYRAKQHRWSTTKYPCASCPICLISSSEDFFHFVVGCFDEWQYWCNEIFLLGIGDIFETEFDVWSGLVSLCDVKQKTLSADMLMIIGSGFSTLWKDHWRCVINGDLWNSQAAHNMFQQDHSSLIADNLASQSPLVVNDSLGPFPSKIFFHVLGTETFRSK
ncbi:hypothetical protein INT47_007552 [Mucor saturninus]|uniref:CCHC-type domain-containing protein n=1 Tax=Mucor saturninus TaxID=64648 RepID=A0A8H7QFX4_9FUNG|nr:hypothetical protein INT47_007552 [Mucor saturninus]